MSTALETTERSVTLSDRQVSWLRAELRTYERSGLVPKALQDEVDNKGVVTTDRSADRMLVAVTGAHLGLAIPVSFAHLFPIDGKVCQSAQLALALAQRAGHEVWTESSSSQECTVKGFRKGKPEQVQSVQWTIEDARTAGLASTTYELWSQTESGRKFCKKWIEGDGVPPEWIKDRNTKKVRKTNWISYPQAMLRARAQKAWVVMAAPEVLMGMDLSFIDDVLDTPAHMPPVNLPVIDVEPEPDDIPVHEGQGTLV